MKVFNIILLGTSEFTLTCYEALKLSKQNVQAIICTTAIKLPLNSVNIKSFCKKEKVKYFEIDDLSDKSSLDFLDKMNPDFIFSTWPFIITKEVMDKARFGVIGSHPTKLPENRGRHPIHWLIDFGSTSSELSFFLMDDGIDTGNILHQEKFKIYPKKEISFTLKELNKASLSGIKKLFLKKLQSPKITGVKQNHNKANYLRKRNIHDSIIDLRMRGEDILSLYNSFAAPYPGISFIWGKSLFKVQKMKFKPMQQKQNQTMEHGKIIRCSGKKLVCKCRNGILELDFERSIPAALTTKKYVMPPSYYLTKYNSQLSALIG